MGQLPEQCRFWAVAAGRRFRPSRTEASSRRLYTCLCACLFTCPQMPMHMSTHVCMHACTHVYTHVYMHVCTHVYTHWAKVIAIGYNYQSDLLCEGRMARSSVSSRTEASSRRATASRHNSPSRLSPCSSSRAKCKRLGHNYLL